MFAYIILQFGAFAETEKCVSSILKYCYEDSTIIIVDNCSPDDSYERAVCEYSNYSYIDILKTPKNLGFANGNNYGIKYAREKYDPDFVVVLNNDTELLNSNFQPCVVQEYTESKFYVLGPMILTGDGKYTSSPCRKNEWNQSGIRKCIYLESLFLTLTRINFGFLYSAYLKLKRKLHNDALVCCENHLKRQENVELHGSFLVFSKAFLEEFGGFDTRTFMYCEEPILYNKLMKTKKKIVYNPNIIVFHKEDASTENAHKRSKDKKIFYLSNHIESCKILLEVMNERI